MSSPVQLLAPSAPAGAVLRIGSGCPPGLDPVESTTEGPFDVVIVAPGTAERRDPSWLRGAARRAAAVVDPSGVVYVLAPLGARRRLLAELRRNGLTVTTPFVHLPSIENTRVIAPARPAPLRYALRQFAIGDRTGRAVAAGALQLPGARRLLGYLPTGAIAARRPTAPPPFAWFPGSSGGATPVLVFPLRRYDGSFSFHEFSRDGDDPIAVAKLLASPAEAERRTHVLKAASDHARRAGAETPELLASFPGSPLVRQGIVRGTPGQVVLDGRPRRLEPVTKAIVDWLVRWNERTAQKAVLERAHFDDWIFTPLARLEADLPAGTRYHERLERLCRRLEGASVPVVWAHGDLTMSNVLVRHDGGIGVVDWESAGGGRLPLSDLYYSFVDAVAAIERYSDRVAAVKECFGANGRYVQMAGRWCDHLAHSLGVGDDVAVLSFHACWLGHALKESRVESATAPRPFAHILRWVSETDRLVQRASL